MVVKLKNGKKFTVESVNENPNGILRNRQRSTMEIAFAAAEKEFAEIQAAFTPENLQTITVYYPENETQDSTEEQLEGVAQQEFEGYQVIGEWKNTEVQQNAGMYLQEPVYVRKLSVTLGQLQYGESI